MLDLSMSMPMRDNFLPAKKVAMALHRLISSQFPRDYLGIVGFSETARVLTAGAAARGVVGLRVRHEHAPRVHARPPAARPAERHEADHHDHRRRTDRPHHAERRRRTSTTRPCARRSRRRCARSCAARSDGIRINTFMLDADGSLTRLHREDDRDQPWTGVLHDAGDARRLRARGLHGGQARPSPDGLVGPAEPHAHRRTGGRSPRCARISKCTPCESAMCYGRMTSL